MYEYRAKVERVVDGDTVDVVVDLGFDVHVRQRLRLLGINAPEKTGPTREAGYAARDYLAELLGAGPVTVSTSTDAREKYGRYLAWIIAGGVRVNQAMVEAGHAVRANY